MAGTQGLLVATIRRYPRQLAATLVALVIAGSGGACTSLLIKVMLDRGLYPPGGVRMAVVLLSALGMVGLATLAAAAGLVATYYGEGVIHAFARDLRLELFGSMVSRPLAELQQRRMGEVSTRFVSDLGLIETTLQNAGMGLVANALFLLASIAAMAYLSLPLCLGSLALTPLLVWLTRRVTIRQSALSGAVQDEVDALAVLVDDNLSSAGATQARLFDRVPTAVGDFDRIADRLYRLQVRRAMLLGRLDASFGIFFAAIPALLYVGAGYAIAGGHSIDTGSLVAFVALQTRFFGPVGQVMQLTAQLGALPPALRRVAEYRAAEPDRAEQPTRAVAGGATQPVAVRHLGFSYRPAAGGAGFRLHDIDLDLPPGSSVALVGASGSGKSTLALVLAGLLTPDTGTARVGDRQAEAAGIPALLRGQVGLVTQEPHVLHASVADNISYGRPDATPAEIVTVARAARLDEFVQTLPDGYDTVLGQAGAQLSGGQRRRLCVARVLLSRPGVIVFDETGSGLDRGTEELMWRSIRQLMPGHTQVLISHARDTVAGCDLVYRLAAGTVVEVGQHAQLLSRSAGYRQFWGL